MKTILTTAALAVSMLAGLNGSTSAQTREPAPAVANDAQTMSRLAALESFELAREREAKAIAEKREADDLVAQASMAESTSEIADLTEWQVGLAFITMIGLAVSIGCTVYSINQTRAVIRENRQYSETGLRAYVGRDESEVHHYDVGETPELIVSYKNFGTTPALKLRTFGFIEKLQGFPHSHQFSLPGQIEYEDVDDLPPGATKSVGFSLGPLTETRAKELEDQKSAYAFFLIVIYEDVFGVQDVLRVSGIRSGKKLVRTRLNTAFYRQTHRDIPAKDTADPRQRTTSHG